MTAEKTPFWTSLFRSQFASIVATTSDFLVTIVFTELLQIWYVISNACGAFTGAIVSFWLGRNWAFKRQSKNWIGQAFRYALVSLASMGLNTYGVYFLTETFDIQYIVSKTIVAIIVGICFNFFLFRYFVFR